MEGHSLQLHSSRRDVILMLGITGVGKSTLAEILFGQLGSLESVADPRRCCYQILNTKAPVKTKSQFTSDTICPQVFTDPLHPNLAIYDCPGFEDTRGTSNEIATGLFIANVVQHAERVKIVVTVGYDAVQHNSDRTKFIERVLAEVLEFVKNDQLYQGAVFLLVNKVEGDFSDEDLVRSIALFLEEAQEFAKGKWTEEKNGDIDRLFQGSWLLKTDDGNKYSNIGLMRKITGAGPLNKMPAVTDRRERIRSQLLDCSSFEFLPCKPVDFRCPLSSTALLEVRSMRRSLVRDVENGLKSLRVDVETRFKRSSSNEVELSRKLRHFANFYDDIEDLEVGGRKFSRKTIHMFRHLEQDFRMEGRSEMLGSVWKNLEFLSCVDVTDSDDNWNELHGKTSSTLGKMKNRVGFHAGVFKMFPTLEKCVD